MDDRHPPRVARLSLPLVDPWGRDSGRLELVVRRDHVTVWLGDRCVAVAERTLLQHWLAHRRGPLRVDDITLSTEGTRLCLAVDRFAPYLLPERFVGELVAVV